MSGSKPGKRILRSLSRRISTFTLEQRQEEGQPHAGNALRVLGNEDLDLDPRIPRAPDSRGLRGVLLEPPRVPDGGQGALQHLDVHCKKQKFPVFPAGSGRRCGSGREARPGAHGAAPGPACAGWAAPW